MHSESGLEILAFPCNNFGGQEPGTIQEILDFARHKSGATFPIFGKLQCDNKESTHPLYQFLMAKAPQQGWSGWIGRGLKWNFAKFLCDAEGVPVQRYLPTVFPLGIETDIKKLLDQR